MAERNGREVIIASDAQPGCLDGELRTHLAQSRLARHSLASRSCGPIADSFRDRSLAPDHPRIIYRSMPACQPTGCGAAWSEVQLEERANCTEIGLLTALASTRVAITRPRPEYLP